ACPYSLSPASCGHSFCALCLLQWYFTHLCDACSSWCSELACPLCRAELPNDWAGELIWPRPMFTLPFTPSRLADERVTALVDMLCGPVPTNSSEGSSSRRKMSKGKKPQSPKEAGPSSGWEHGGRLREEWQDRNRYAH
ncbi:uncharacterized protein B0H18DRAFT_878767, partial [Fomitopsis serialis]|uniref:uncharacterized protein n=1 Tax=Fomitopsis serialis TaxID=139415 RepID=UPI002007B9A3